MFLLNSLKKPDIIFFVACLIIILIIVAVYFLIPVIKRKEFAERRRNLKLREEAYNANRQKLMTEVEPVEESTEGEALEAVAEDSVSEPVAEVEDMEKGEEE